MTGKEKGTPRSARKNSFIMPVAIVLPASRFRHDPPDYQPDKKSRAP